MTKYVMREDSGASETIEADTIEQALDEAREWVAGGSYDERALVQVYVHELDQDDEPTGQSTRAEVMVGPEPKAPDCADGQEHAWQAPYDLVGGIKENPGVWGTGGTGLTVRKVCEHCGCYRVTQHTGSQRNPGQLPETVTYEDADERSLQWISDITAEDIPEVTEEQFAAGVVRRGIA